MADSVWWTCSFLHRWEWAVCLKRERYKWITCVYLSRETNCFCRHVFCLRASKKKQLKAFRSRPNPNSRCRTVSCSGSNLFGACGSSVGMFIWVDVTWVETSDVIGKGEGSRWRAVLNSPNEDVHMVLCLLHCQDWKAVNIWQSDVLRLVRPSPTQKRQAENRQTKTVHLALWFSDQKFKSERNCELFSLNCVNPFEYRMTCTNRRTQNLNLGYIRRRDSPD